MTLPVSALTVTANGVNTACSWCSGHHRVRLCRCRTLWCGVDDLCAAVTTRKVPQIDTTRCGDRPATLTTNDPQADGQSLTGTDATEFAVQAAI